MLRIDIEKSTVKNNNYRKVIYTDSKIQVVLMSLKENEDIHREVHKGAQFIRVERGNGWAEVGRRKVILKDGVAITIPPNTEHYIKSTKGLKLYTIYSPPVHEVGLVERIA